MKHKRNIVLLFIPGIFLTLLFVFGVTFKKLRLLFPEPMISSEKAVGFAQYNGYPIYFDTVLFLLILSAIFLSVSITKYLYTKFL